MSSSDDFSDRPQGTPGFSERRRHPRRRAGSDLVLNFPAVVNAQVLDISASGALVSTPAHVVPGTRCQLRTLLSREPFTAFAEVRRVTEGTRAATAVLYHLGLRFEVLDENSRRTLSRFVKEPGESR